MKLPVMILLLLPFVLLWTVQATDPCPLPATGSGDYWNMYVASGKSPNDLGNYDMCQSLPNSKSCAAIINPTSEPQYQSMVCLPANCTNDQIIASLAQQGDVFQFLMALYVPLSYIAPIYPYCPELDGGSWSNGGIATLVLCCVLFALLIVATLYECFRGCFAHMRKWTQSEVTSSATVPLLEKTLDSPQEEGTEPQPAPALPFAVEALLSFSIKHNVSRMLSVNADRGGETASLNGVRALSMALVILGHTLYFMTITGVWNEQDMYPPNGALKDWTFQIIPSAAFAVDSFFMLSGFLVALSMIKRVQSGKSLNVVMLYVHRYLRLTPVLAFAVLIVGNVSQHFSSGPLWFYYAGWQPDACRTWGYTNILYINNFVPWSNNFNRQCLGWTWYLANDMQFFLVSPFLILAYKRSKPLGVAIMAGLTLLSILVLGIVSHHNKFYSLADFSGTKNWGDASTFVYEKPWFRAPAYLIGMLGAVFWTSYRTSVINWLSRPRNKDAYLKAVAKYLCLYAVTVAVMLSIFYGATSYYSVSPETWSTTRLLMYSVLTRPVWCLGLCVLCIMWFATPTDPLGKFMSWPVWEIVARLTYGAYIVHPVIICTIYASMTQFNRYSPIQLAANFVCMWGLSYGVSAGLFLLVEKPFMNLEALVFKKFGIA